MAFWRLYYHLVWATKNRAPMITPEIEEKLYSHIGRRASSEGALIYAINGTEDHIHVIAAVPPTQSISRFMKLVKGSSAHWINTVNKVPFE